MSQAAASTGAPQALAPGQLVGGRFSIERPAREDALGTVFRAIDQRTKRPIALRVVPAALFSTNEAQEGLKNEIKIASAIPHKGLSSTFGTGVEKSGVRFVATEWVDGLSVAEELAEKKLGAGGISFADAVNAVAQIAEALAALHAKNAVHGAVRPAVVWARPKAKLGEVGVSRAALKAGGPAALGASELTYLAPEVRAGGAPSVAGDVFGLGAVFYALVCGRSPEEFVPPSQAHPEANAAADAFLLKCLAPDPAGRFANANEVKDAALALLGAKAPRRDPSIEIDIDVDLARKSAMPPASGAALEIGQRVSLHEDFRPSLAASIGSGGIGSGGIGGGGMPMGAGPLDAPSAPATSALVDLSSLLEKIGTSDAARWMVTKGGLDHGPFSGRELVQLISKGEFLADDGLMNMDTGERKKVREHHDFAEFAEQWRLKKQSMDEERAIVVSAKTETTGNRVKFLIAGAVFITVAIIAGGFFYSRQGERADAVATANLADLYERGEVDIEGTAGILEDPPRRSGGGGGRRGGGGGGGGGRSYEDAMNEVVNMGDVTGSGGSESRLAPAQVAGVMNAHINSFFGCVANEVRGGHSPGRVRIDMAIAGNGSVIGSTVRAGSPEFQRCVQGRVAAIHFPSFGAPRMGASFSFSAD